MARSKKNKGRLLGVHCSIAGGLLNVIEAGEDLGCSAIQIFTGSNQQWRAPRISLKEADAFRGRLSASCIEIAFAHSIYLINLASHEREIYRKSIDAMVGELERTEMLGLPFVVVHPGAPKEKGAAWGVKRVAESVNKVVERTKDLNAKIALETTAGQGSSVGHTFEQLAEMIDGVEEKRRVCVCLDTCHVFAAGYDLRDAQAYKKMWKEFDETLRMKMLAAVHLNDSKGGLGSRIDRHEHVGDGEIGLAGFRNVMSDRRLVRIPMVLETPKEEKSHTKGDSMNLRLLRRLIK